MKTAQEWSADVPCNVDSDTQCLPLIKRIQNDARDDLLKALKEALESFAFLDSRIQRTPEPSMLNECKDCVVDAIAQIQDRFNYEQSRRGEK